MPSISLSASLRGQLLTSGRFNPLSIFAASEPGWLYDNSDMSTLFQDSAGTTPVTAVGQPVGLQLDKSKGLVLGPELVVNGSFVTDTNWIKGTGWTISGGSANSVQPNNLQALTQVMAFPAGTYRVSFTISNYIGGQLAARFSGGGSDLAPSVLANGTYSFLLTATAARTQIDFLTTGGTGFTGSIDNISVKELAGNHRTQSTAASRPTFARLPVTGRRNLLTYTEQFDNAAWAKSGATVTPNAASAPDGNTTADAIVSISGTSFGVNNTGMTMSAGNHTVSVYAKANGFNYLKLTWLSGANGTDYAVFNLATGVVTGGVYTAAAISPVGNGWYRCSITSLCASTAAGGAYLWMSDGTLSRGSGVTGNGTSGIYIWGAQLELGSTATNYQKVVSLYDITEAGVQTAYGLYYDGVDDFLVTPTITPGTDKVQVFAGVRKLSDANVQTLVELSTSGDSANAGSFYLRASFLGNEPNYGASTRGSNQMWRKTASAYPAPNTAVLTAELTSNSSVLSDAIRLRVNGASSVGGDSGATASTGNYLAYPVYFGRRGGASLPFLGYVFREVGRFGPNLDAATIANTEAWINQNTGAY